MTKKPNGYWTKERCLAEAGLYSSVGEFNAMRKGAYLASMRQGILEDMCAHMQRKKQPNGYWTKGRCAARAKLHSTRTAFKNAEPGAHCSAAENGWLDDICAHMDRRGNRALRHVYVIMSREQRSVYVGLSFNVRRRIAEHKRGGALKVQALLAKPHRIFISGLMSKNEAGHREIDLISRFRDRGYVALNVTRGGTLGGAVRKWTKDACVTEAVKYSTRRDFQVGSPSAYQSAHRNGWLDEVCAHTVPGVITGRVPYWTRDRVMAEALKFTRRWDFGMQAKGAYTAAKKHGWYDEAVSHMPPPVVRNQYSGGAECHL
jgi:predicted GIY-YIG superfamily endonuclease